MRHDDSLRISIRIRGEAGRLESQIQGNFGVLLAGESSQTDSMWMVIEPIGPVSPQDPIELLSETNCLAHMPSHSRQMP